MSAVHIGPYIDCIRDRKPHSFSAPGCAHCLPGLAPEMHSTVANFCFNCGLRLETIHKTYYEWLPDSGEVKAALDDVGNPNGFQIVADAWQLLCIPRIFKNQHCFYYAHNCSKVLMHLRGVIDIDAFIEDFISENKVQIDALKKLFGDDNVSVKWGVIVYDRKEFLIVGDQASG